MGFMCRGSKRPNDINSAKRRAQAKVCSVSWVCWVARVNPKKLNKLNEPSKPKFCSMRYAVTGEGDLKWWTEKIEEAILAKAKDGKIPCAVCFKIADDLGIPKKELTKALNEMKIKISECQLGCFE